MTAVHTWADGFGNWHARTDSAFDAWWAIRAEHLARGAASPAAMRELMKVREVEPGEWVEWWPSYDARENGGES